MYIWQNELKTLDFWFQMKILTYFSFFHKESPLSIPIVEAAITHKLAIVFPASKGYPDLSKVHNSKLLIHFRRNLDYQNFAVSPQNKCTIIFSLYNFSYYVHFTNRSHSL